jgi:chromosome segregation ATPase
MLDQLNRQVDFLNGELAKREGQIGGLTRELKSTESIRSSAKIAIAQVSEQATKVEELTSTLRDVEDKCRNLEDQNSNLKKQADSSRKKAATARHEQGVRDSGGSLPGSIGGSKPNSPAHHAHRVPTSSITVTTTNLPPAPANTPASTPSEQQAVRQVSRMQKEMTELRIALSSAEAEANQLNADNDRLAEALSLARDETEATRGRNDGVGQEREEMRKRCMRLEKEKGRAEEELKRR